MASLLKLATPILITFSIYLLFSTKQADAQALADPAREYIGGYVGGRRIYWCPSGYGYLAFCPQPSDYDSHTWCCVWPYWENSWRPACCPFAIPTGAVVCVILGAMILFVLLIFLSCWCCFCCPLHKKIYEDEKEDEYPKRNRNN